MSGSPRGLASDFNRATEALTRTVKSSIVWPLLVAVVPLTLICLGTMPFVAWPLNIALFPLAAFSFASFLVVFIILLVKDPDSLRSEEYQRSMRVLDLVEKKGGRIQVKPVELTPASEPPLDSGDEEKTHG
jgi:membrane protein implicated in regulation of membrane protease activity